VHWTHFIAAQIGVAPPPSALHCALVVHVVAAATQRPVAMSQTGSRPKVAALHSALVVHIAWHVWMLPLQIGLAAGQSLSSMHWTHMAVAGSHAGVAAALQSAFTAHCTH
jgi:hypothetical protein